MKVDIVGRIRNMRVLVQHAFHPVFEAVVNSIHATEKRFGNTISTEGKIEVRIHRVPQGVLALGVGPGRAPIPEVAGFTIVDNGEGFTDANLGAFETADTTAKAELGGKGVGRFAWLVVFDRAIVASTFLTDGKKRRRSFLFRPTRSAIENFEESDVPDTPDLETRVELRGLHPRFADELRKSAEVIADRLFEHCFNYFVIGRCARVRLIDEAPDAPGPIDVNGKVAEVSISDPRPLTVGTHNLQARHVQEKSRPGRKHMAHLCAHHRVVTQIPLSEVSNLGSDPIKGSDGQLVVHHVFVGGPALDEAVDSSRTHLNLPEGQPLLERGGALDLQTLREELGKHVNEQLSDTLKAEREENFEKIQRHVRTEQPEYRHLVQRAPELLRNVKYTENRKQLDEGLYRAKQQWEADVRRRQAEVEARLAADDADPDQIAEELERLIGEVNDAGQGDLVRYVVQRRAVLNLLGRLISKFRGPALEENVHRIVFPLRKTGDEVAIADHNLWLVDDTLSFYEFIYSDKPLSKSEAAPSDSGRRPDVLAFKTGDPYQHVAIVEFKRPDREDENPVQQLVDYSVLLRDGGARDAGGVTMTGIPKNVRIDGYAVCTLTPNLEQMIRRGPGNMAKIEAEGRWLGLSQLKTFGLRYSTTVPSYGALSRETRPFSTSWACHRQDALKAEATMPSLTRMTIRADRWSRGLGGFSIPE